MEFLRTESIAASGKDAGVGDHPLAVIRGTASGSLGNGEVSLESHARVLLVQKLESKHQDVSVVEFLKCDLMGDARCLALLFRDKWPGIFRGCGCPFTIVVSRFTNFPYFLHRNAIALLRVGKICREFFFVAHSPPWVNSRKIMVGPRWHEGPY